MQKFLNQQLGQFSSIDQLGVWEKKKSHFGKVVLDYKNGIKVSDNG
jgi:hypothetical protein